MPVHGGCVRMTIVAAVTCLWRLRYQVRTWMLSAHDINCGSCSFQSHFCGFRMIHNLQAPKGYVPCTTNCSCQWMQYNHVILPRAETSAPKGNYPIIFDPRSCPELSVRRSRMRHWSICGQSRRTQGQLR